MSEKKYNNGVKLTMDEQIKQLRNEKKWTMDYVEKKTGISKSAQQRYENSDSMYIPYKIIMKYAELYNVSLDYMCGLTLNRNLREFPIDELCLTDKSIEFLKKNNNVEIINELLSHNDLHQLLTAMELYVSDTISPGVNTNNSILTMGQDLIKSKVDVTPDDKTIQYLQLSKINHKSYLKFDITQQFNTLLECIYNNRKRKIEDQPLDISELVKQNIINYINNPDLLKKDGYGVLVEILGIPKDLVSEEKMQIFLEVLRSSPLCQEFNKQCPAYTSREQRRNLKKQTKHIKN